jgi:hypothetical protein
MGLRMRDNKDKYLRKMYQSGDVANTLCSDSNARESTRRTASNANFKRISSRTQGIGWSLSRTSTRGTAGSYGSPLKRPRPAASCSRGRIGRYSPILRGGSRSISRIKGTNSKVGFSSKTTEFCRFFRMGSWSRSS